MHKFFSLVLLSALLLASSGAHSAFADDWRDHGDIRHFHDHDYDHWRGGRWFNGDHEGRHGWWWIVDGGWYFYPAPVYPYPDPYSPPVVVSAPVPVSPMGVPPSYVYYCRNPAGYYPYVPQCFGHWHRVASGAVATTTIVQQQPQVVVTQQPPMAAVHTREEESDLRKLNALAADFANVDLTGQRAAARLGELARRVENFRKALYRKNYDTTGVMRNTDDLQHRIAEQRAHLGSMRSLPPGAPVAFPPQ